METIQSPVITSGQQSFQQSVNAVKLFFESIRPAYRRRNAAVNLSMALQRLAEQEEELEQLRNAVWIILSGCSLRNALLTSGIPPARGFWQEFFDRLKHKLLPPLLDSKDLQQVIRSIFYRHDDFIWVESIDLSAWTAFFDLLTLPIESDSSLIRDQLTEALRVMSIQLAQLSLEPELFSFLPAEKIAESPFIRQQERVTQMATEVISFSAERQAVLTEEIFQLLRTAELQMQEVREQQAYRGTSLTQTYLLLLMQHRVRRMRFVLEALSPAHHLHTARMVDYFRLMLRNENTRDSIRSLLSQGAGFLAYEIVSQKGKKGNKYITSDWRSYGRMFFSAAWGGFIISFVAVSKNLIARLPFTAFWHGMLYSANYAAGFVIIEETGCTLATKQPAFTASALAASFEKKGTENNYLQLSVTVAKVSRSQLASYFGNLLVVFPLTYFLAWGYQHLTGNYIAEGAAAMQLLRNQHPGESLSLLYACNTGVFLFLSGLVAGYTQNKIRYAGIAARLVKESRKGGRWKDRFRHKLAYYLSQHGGALAGNIFLGFMLGMSAVATEILGIPFDIRHITISAGNTAIGLYGLGPENVPFHYLVLVFLGVMLIGFLNFLVSFSLAFYTAFKAKGLHARDFPDFFAVLWRYFRRAPLDFIRPRRRTILQE